MTFFDRTKRWVIRLPFRCYAIIKKRYRCIRHLQISRRFWLGAAKTPVTFSEKVLLFVCEGAIGNAPPHLQFVHHVLEKHGKGRERVEGLIRLADGTDPGDARQDSTIRGPRELHRHEHEAVDSLVIHDREWWAIMFEIRPQFLGE